MLNLIETLISLGKQWETHNSYGPSCEDCARDSAINYCGEELLEVIALYSAELQNEMNSEKGVDKKSVS